MSITTGNRKYNYLVMCFKEDYPFGKFLAIKSCVVLRVYITCLYYEKMLIVTKVNEKYHTYNTTAGYS